MQITSTRPEKSLDMAAVGKHALASPMSRSTPDQPDATPTLAFHGCVLYRAAEPRFSHRDNLGEKVVDYPVSIVCSGNRSVRFEQRAYEEISGHDVLRALQTSEWLAFDGLNGLDGTNGPSKKTFGFKLSLLHTAAGEEETYHQLRIQVRSDGVTSAWSPWSFSPVLSINN